MMLNCQKYVASGSFGFLCEYFFKKVGRYLKWSLGRLVTYITPNMYVAARSGQTETKELN